MTELQAQLLLCASQSDARLHKLIIIMSTVYISSCRWQKHVSDTRIVQDIHVELIEIICRDGSTLEQKLSLAVWMKFVDTLSQSWKVALAQETMTRIALQHLLLQVSDRHSHQKCITVVAILTTLSDFGNESQRLKCASLPVVHEALSCKRSAIRKAAHTLLGKNSLAQEEQTALSMAVQQCDCDTEMFTGAVCEIPSCLLLFYDKQTFNHFEDLQTLCSSKMDTLF